MPDAEALRRLLSCLVVATLCGGCAHRSSERSSPEASTAAERARAKEQARRLTPRLQALLRLGRQQEGLRIELSERAGTCRAVAAGRQAEARAVEQQALDVRGPLGSHLVRGAREAYRCVSCFPVALAACDALERIIRDVDAELRRPTE